MDKSKDLRQSFSLFVLSTIVLWVAVVFIGTVGFVTNHYRTEEGQRAHKAICVLVNDYHSRIREQENFIKTHPHGFANITVAQIKRSIAMEHRTLEALSVARC